MDLARTIIRACMFLLFHYWNTTCHCESSVESSPRRVRTEKEFVEAPTFASPKAMNYDVHTCHSRIFPNRGLLGAHRGQGVTTNSHRECLPTLSDVENDAKRLFLTDFGFVFC